MNKLREVNPQMIVQDPRGETRWYSDDINHIYFIRSDKEVLHLEITIGQDILICSPGKVPAQGVLSDDKIEGLYYRASRTISMKKELDQGFLYAAHKLVETCEGLEHDIVLAIARYFTEKKREMKFSRPIGLRSGLKKKSGSGKGKNAGDKGADEDEDEKEGLGDKIIFSLGILGIALFAFAVASFIFQAEIGCKLGKAHHCLDVAKAKLAGDPQEQSSLQKSSELLLPFCQQGHGESCQFLFDNYVRLNNDVEARRSGGKACELGFAEQCLWLAENAEKRGEPEDSAHFYSLACQYHQAKTKLPPAALKKSKFCARMQE
jgi:hypothetical protein